MAQSLCQRPPAHGLTGSVQACFGKGLEPLEVERKGRISFSENRRAVETSWLGALRKLKPGKQEMRELPPWSQRQPGESQGRGVFP